jgi:CSLREA domain-containing protein
MKRLRTASLAAALLLGSFASIASANPITPSTTADDFTNNGNCTLREAVQAANTDMAVDQCPAGKGGDLIQLGALTYDLGLPGAKEDGNQTGDLDVTSPLTIQGQGAGTTTIDAHSIDRAIDVLPGGTTEIKNLTITNGAAPTTGTFTTGGAGEAGGAIRSQFVLVLTGVSVTNSHAGSGATGAAVTLDGNPGGDGGGVWSNWPLEITGGSFDHDHAGDGSAGAGGLPAFSGNGNPGHPGGDGGAGGSGGAIAVAGGAQLTVTGTTFNEVHTGTGGTGGNGSAGNGNPGGTGGTGGDAGNGAVGGSGGAVSATGPATLTGITATFAVADGGGDAGKGGAGGSGNTPAHQGQTGTNGIAGVGGSGGAVAGGAGALTIGGATFHIVHAGAGGAGPQEAEPSASGGLAGAGGRGGAVSGGTVSVSHTLFSVTNAGTGGLSGTTLGAQASAGGDGGPGGGIDGVTVTVTDTTISASQGGLGGNGSDNSSVALPGNGGRGGGGGGVHAASSLMMNNVELDHDVAGPGGDGGTGATGSNGGTGGSGGGVLAGHGGTITNVTLRGDVAGPGGAAGAGSTGGIGGDGGGIRADAAGLSLAHVTVVGNAAGPAGDAASGNPGFPGAGGGISGLATVNDSVVAGNDGTQCVFTTNGTGNVSFPDNSCGGVNADPKLRPLADNGGSTLTMLPGPGSAALDIIPAGSADCSGTDQRGVPRPQGPACDSGAVEAANPALTADAADFGPVPQGGTPTKTITVRDTFDPLHPQVSLSSPDFSIVSDGCSGVALAPAATCPVQVRFTATSSPGPRSATLHVTHDAAGPALDVPLTATVVDTVPPVLSSLSLAHKTFAVAKRKPPPKGTRISFSLSEPASVKFTVIQRLPGRRKGKRCVAPTRKLRHAKHCTRTKTLGSFTRSAAAGRSSLPFNGRIAGRKLKPGSYSLTASPTDPSGNHGLPAGVAFKIVKR